MLSDLAVINPLWNKVTQEGRERKKGGWEEGGIRGREEGKNK